MAFIRQLSSPLAKRSTLTLTNLFQFGILLQKEVSLIQKLFFLSITWVTLLKKEIVLKIRPNQTAVTFVLRNNVLSFQNETNTVNRSLICKVLKKNN